MNSVQEQKHLEQTVTKTLSTAKVFELACDGHWYRAKVLLSAHLCMVNPSSVQATGIGRLDLV